MKQEETHSPGNIVNIQPPLLIFILARFEPLLSVRQVQNHLLLALGRL